MIEHTNNINNKYKPYDYQYENIEETKQIFKI